MITVESSAGGASALRGALRDAPPTTVSRARKTAVNGRRGASAVIETAGTLAAAETRAPLCDAALRPGRPAPARNTGPCIAVTPTSLAAAARRHPMDRVGGVGTTRKLAKGGSCPPRVCRRRLWPGPGPPLGRRARESESQASQARARQRSGAEPARPPAAGPRPGLRVWVATVDCGCVDARERAPNVRCT